MKLKYRNARLGARTARVARWFGLDTAAPRPARYRDIPIPPIPAPGEILLITGPSGSGKSSLLRRIRRQIPARRRIDLGRLRLDSRPLAELFPGVTLEEWLKLLARVGLAEAHTYILPPQTLSAGQRWRLRLALAIYLARQRRRRRDQCVSITCDEFASMLDPVTAAVVAHALRRFIDCTGGVCAIIASSRDDLVAALQPDRIVECDFAVTRILKSSGQ